MGPVEDERKDKLWGAQKFETFTPSLGKYRILVPS